MQHRGQAIPMSQRTDNEALCAALQLAHKAREADSHVLKQALDQFNHYKAAPLFACGPFAVPDREVEAEARCVFDEGAPDALLRGNEFLADCRPTEEDPPTFTEPWESLEARLLPPLVGDAGRLSANFCEEGRAPWLDPAGGAAFLRTLPLGDSTIAAFGLGGGLEPLPFLAKRACLCF